MVTLTTVAPFEAQFIAPLLNIGCSCHTLNQTSPSPVNVAAVWPDGTFAIQNDSGPGWKMSGLTVKLTALPADTDLIPLVLTPDSS